MKRTDRVRISPGGAFTLIELIVALGITGFIAGAMITIVAKLLTASEKSRGSLVGNNQAKFALDFLAQDLQSAIMRPDGNIWMVATIQSDQTTKEGDSGASMAHWTETTDGMTKPTNSSPESSLQLFPTTSEVPPKPTYLLEDYRFGMAGVWLRLFATEPDTNEPSKKESFSVVRAIGYQIIRYKVADRSGTSIRYGLFRSSVRPYHSDAYTAFRSTFFIGYNLFSPPYNDPDALIDGSTVTVELAGEFEDVSQYGGSGLAEPGGIRRPDRSQLLANNVIDFGVRFWVRDGSGNLVLAFPNSPSNLGFAATTNNSLLPPYPLSGAPSAAQMNYGFPTTVDVFIRVLNDDGAKVLEEFERNPPAGSTDLDWWQTAIANSKVYTRQVKIKGGAF